MSGALHLLPCGLATGESLSTVPARSLEQARALDYFLVENAKSARAYLKEIGHPQPLQALQIVQIGHEPDAGQIDTWLAPVVAGRNAGVLSEAGLPAVADPGAQLVQRAHALGLRVVPHVGPSSLMLALMASGMNGQRFRFVGYLPQEPAARTEAIRELERAARSGETQLLIETPYRNDKLLDALLATCAPDTQLALAVDLTSPQEQTLSASIADWRQRVKHQRPPLDKRPAVFCLSARARRT